MNGLEIVVIGIIALCAYAGYRRGFLRVIYSLMSWILVLGFVTWSTPYITEYLEEKTELKAYIQEKCLEHIEQSAEAKIEQNALEISTDTQKEMSEIGIWLPESIMEKFSESSMQTAELLFEESGIYTEIADTIAHFIIEGIAFFAALLTASIVTRYLASALDLVSYLPIIKGANKMLGVAAGLLKGLIIIWLGFYIITICAASDIGNQLLAYIEESSFLPYLYNHNILLEIIMIFL
ncbi:MAG: CvpA family protein [Lachnospiraceae bacterium]|nr:CvpA family protein [Lachnospiraceae bacterium]